MALKNLECEAIQEQLSRYMGGEYLADATMATLEAHIRRCATCAVFIQSDRHDRAWRANTPSAPTHAVISSPMAAPTQCDFMTNLNKTRAALDRAVKPSAAGDDLQPNKVSGNPFPATLVSLIVAIAAIGSAYVFGIPDWLLPSQEVPDNLSDLAPRRPSSAKPVGVPDRPAEGPNAIEATMQAEFGAAGSATAPAISDVASPAPAKTSSLPAKRSNVAATRPRVRAGAMAASRSRRDFDKSVASNEQGKRGGIRVYDEEGQLIGE